MPKAARDVAPGESWAWRDHKPLSEHLVQETKEKAARASLRRYLDAKRLSDAGRTANEGMRGYAAGH